MRNYKKFWRSFFKEYFVGDRVSIPDYNRKGFIVRKFWSPANLYVPVPHWEYEVKFDHALRLDRKFFPIGKRLCDGFFGISYDEMRFIR